MRDVVAAEGGLISLVLRAHRVHIPVEHAIANVEIAFQAGAEIPGIDILLEDARATLDRPPPDKIEVAGVEIYTKRVERIVSRNENIVGQRIAGAGARAKEDRLRRGLVGRLPVVVQELGLPAHPLRDIVIDACEHALALARGQQQVEFREVEAICTAIKPDEVARKIRPVGEALTIGRGDIAQCYVRSCRILVVIDQRTSGVWRRVDKYESPIRRSRAAESQARARRWKPRLLGGGGADRIGLVVAGRQQETGLVGLPTPGQIGSLVFAVRAIEGTPTDVDLRALEVLLGDDVDHAGNGIGAIQRRGAVFQHFDVIDNRHRDGVEVGGGGHARGRRLTHPAQAIDQHQHPLGAEVAQIDGGGTGANAAAIGWEAEVAGRIELGVEARTGCGDLLQHIADRGQTGAIDVGASDDLHRRQPFQLGFLDARTGHFDPVEGLGIILRRFLRERDQRQCAQQQRAADRGAESTATK